MANKRKILNIQDATLWYLVGLITADGCLSLDGRHVDITAKDYCFLQGLKEKVGFKNKIGIKNQGKSNEAYHIQLSNKNLY
ncbi:MAG: LAGLIDADG family homing endonuclease [Candidatus Omnitrophica bacterium]|nr:LAGLIDADG family homing endonuclease [Candidatus Omnitrophota bacterium]